MTRQIPGYKFITALCPNLKPTWSEYRGQIYRKSKKFLSEEIFLRSPIEEFCQSRKLAKSRDASDSTDALAFDDRSRQSHIVGRTQVSPSAPTNFFTHPPPKKCFLQEYLKDLDQQTRCAM